MGFRGLMLFTMCASALSWAGIAGPALVLNSQGTPSSQPPGKTAQQDSQSNATQTPPHGKKLILKDGNYQLVNSYERIGDRVRYLSTERGEWEEIPASLVDWDATAKAEAANAKEAEAFAEKVHAREEANRTQVVRDVDASLLVGPGVFLPPGEGMFAVQGKSVTQLEQVGSEIKTDKKQFLKQVLSPIPIVPSKRNVDIPGAKAKLRITTAAPEFYLREAPPDPDRVQPIQRSSRPGESGPEVELIRASVKGNKRVLESIKNLFGQEIGRERNTIAIQRWDVAPTVYRFTLGEPLPPGEYAFAEMLPDGMNLFVWDFGVDSSAPSSKANENEKKN